MDGTSISLSFNLLAATDSWYFRDLRIFVVYWDLHLTGVCLHISMTNCKSILLTLNATSSPSHGSASCRVLSWLLQPFRALATPAIIAVLAVTSPAPGPPCSYNHTRQRLCQLVGGSTCYICPSWLCQRPGLAMAATITPGTV